MMIFVTHYYFRRHHDRLGGPAPAFRMAFFPWATLLGAGLMLAVLVTTAFTEVFRLTLVFGLPVLALLAVAFRVTRLKRSA
jgi:AAT family amino acid transporter